MDTTGRRSDAFSTPMLGNAAGIGAGQQILGRTATGTIYQIINYGGRDERQEANEQL